MQCPVGGCGSSAPIALASGKQNAKSIVADKRGNLSSTYVYWANRNSVSRAQVGVPSSGTVIAQNQTGAATAGVGDKAAYWSLSNGTVTMLAK